MRPLVVSTFLTLDGIMQAPGGPEEDPTDGFTHGGWSVGYWDDAMGERMGQIMTPPFDLLLGRKTYEIFAAFWPMPPTTPGAEELNSARKYVASRTLDSVEWNNSTLLEGDVAASVADLKQEDGPEIQVHGARTCSRRCSSTTSWTSSGSWSSRSCSEPESGSSPAAPSRPV